MGAYFNITYSMGACIIACLLHIQQVLDSTGTCLLHTYRCDCLLHIQQVLTYCIFSLQGACSLHNLFNRCLLIAYSTGAGFNTCLLITYSKGACLFNITYSTGVS